MIGPNKIKYRRLFFSVILDLVGYLSYSIPALGEFSDLIWAPISSYLLARMYPGKVGKVGAIVNFIEEISPGLDLIPTFSLTWIYTYVYKK
ncbi:hypothetical protein ACYSNX_10355 [Myroides sp. LJL115]